MKYLWTLFWAFALSHMITYVVGSMSGAPYDFQLGNLIAVGMFIGVSLLPVAMPKEEESL
ncbi:YjzD family protein [Bacillus kwashiorkori]|uniref:YjzD family protein n=1 Tax=Bacillus kwashiorkori TaxID=1522318 RepID=UPI00078171D2|nr:YjzD family protein [Bacillus kwashiorkori]